MKKILYFFLFISCGGTNKTIEIENTDDWIAFDRDVVAANIFDKNVWLTHIPTGRAYTLADNFFLWEYMPLWVSDSELVFVVEPHEKTLTQVNIVYYNLRSRKSFLFDNWTWRNDPSRGELFCKSPDTICYASFNGSKNFYEFYYLPLRDKNAKPILFLSAETLTAIGFLEAFYPVFNEKGDELLIVGYDSIKNQNKKLKNKHYYDIYMYNLVDRNLQNLTNNKFTNKYPLWVDTANIIFSSNRDGNYDLYLMNLQTKEIERLTYTDDIEETISTISPDKKQIAYNRFDFKKTEIWLMDLKTKKTWFLTEGGNPAWSPAK